MVIEKGRPHRPFTRRGNKDEKVALEDGGFPRMGFLLGLGDLLRRIAYLATPSQSGRNPQFRQDARLKQNPYPNNQENPPETHLHLSLPLFPIHVKTIIGSQLTAVKMRLT
jgi:hypothetical protein